MDLGISSFGDKMLFLYEDKINILSPKLRSGPISFTFLYIFKIKYFKNNKMLKTLKTKLYI